MDPSKDLELDLIDSAQGHLELVLLAQVLLELVHSALGHIDLEQVRSALDRIDLEPDLMDLLLEPEALGVFRKVLERDRDFGLRFPEQDLGRSLEDLERNQIRFQIRMLQRIMEVAVFQPTLTKLSLAQILSCHTKPPRYRH